MRNKGRPLPAEDLNFIRGSSGSSAKNDNYLQNGQKSYKDRATYGQRNKDDSILYTVKTVVAPFPVSTSETQWGARSARPLLPKKKIVSNANRGDSYNENDEEQHSHSHSLEEPGSSVEGLHPGLAQSNSRTGSGDGVMLSGMDRIVNGGSNATSARPIATTGATGAAPVHHMPKIRTAEAEYYAYLKSLPPEEHVLPDQLPLVSHAASTTHHQLPMSSNVAVLTMDPAPAVAAGDFPTAVEVASKQALSLIKENNGRGHHQFISEHDPDPEFLSSPPQRASQGGMMNNNKNSGTTGGSWADYSPTDSQEEYEEEEEQYYQAPELTFLPREVHHPKVVVATNGAPAGEMHLHQQLQPGMMMYGSGGQQDGRDLPSASQQHGATTFGAGGHQGAGGNNSIPNLASADRGGHEATQMKDVVRMPSMTKAMDGLVSAIMMQPTTAAAAPALSAPITSTPKTALTTASSTSLLPEEGGGGKMSMSEIMTGHGGQLQVQQHLHHQHQDAYGMHGTTNTTFASTTKTDKRHLEQHPQETSLAEDRQVNGHTAQHETATSTTSGSAKPSYDLQNATAMSEEDLQIQQQLAAKKKQQEEQAEFISAAERAAQVKAKAATWKPSLRLRR
ncbi:unnamed protein product [Amoebophrya sp. A120]|nr:unnamed protein product [Amoebophrya sp. A120]|eukprot:GSA120T00022273001.1